MWRKVVSNVAAHEAAHMWFGNLVTMNSFDDLWLNEAFATFMPLIGFKEMQFIDSQQYNQDF
eukprot:CAMPEP_0116895678 /NCGR_PEP_ID=MMETSP0467-20121206/5140_1 /TAXON_ID=283647 /ORGANISM="Mesodinium pulex, Strain SPMC105" /LENGTH=61 /DNA_ID=CAMNT_0004566525 /DNA_START=760 /DNA_END=945 /DNA_ORIENTATION=+